MHKDQSLKNIEKMPPTERWLLAQKKLSDNGNNGAVPSLLQHIRAHENTRWIIYSPKLSEQIPRSYAAHAFRELQNSVIHYEIVRLCTFWDPVDLDSRSIPTIVALADCKGVSKCVHDTHFKHYHRHDLSLAKRWARNAQRRLRVGVRGAIEIENSDTLVRVRNYRDKLAHQLEQTNAEKKSMVPNMRLGDEQQLLRKTVTTLNRLYLSLSGTSFDWTGAKKMHKRNAKAFWGGVTIEVLR